MIKKYFKLILLLPFLMIQIVNSQTQKATTESGIKVILNSDGTWDFDREKVEQKKISILDTIDCSKWITSEIDKPSGKSEKYFWLDLGNDVQERSISLIFKKSYKGHLEIDINVKDYGEEGGTSRCINVPNIYFLTSKDERIVVYDFDQDLTKSEYPCDGFKIFVGGVYKGNSRIDDLRVSKIKMIRVYDDFQNEKEPSDFFLSEKEQEELWIKLNCLYK